MLAVIGCIPACTLGPLLPARSSQKLLDVLVSTCTSCALSCGGAVLNVVGWKVLAALTAGLVKSAAGALSWELGQGRLICGTCPGCQSGCSVSYEVQAAIVCASVLQHLLKGVAQRHSSHMEYG